MKTVRHQSQVFAIASCTRAPAALPAAYACALWFRTCAFLQVVTARAETASCEKAEAARPVNGDSRVAELQQQQEQVHVRRRAALAQLQSALADITARAGGQVTAGGVSA